MRAEPYELWLGRLFAAIRSPHTVRALACEFGIHPGTVRFWAHWIDEMDLGLRAPPLALGEPPRKPLDGRRYTNRPRRWGRHRARRVLPKQGGE